MKARSPHSIDVIVPVYNGGDEMLARLQQLLALVAEMTADIRLIVCDDGSTDATARHLDSLAGERFVCVTLTHNSGRSAARNAAVAASDARYLLFMDADCLPHARDYFARMLVHVTAGAMLSYGPIAADPGNDPFWRRYLDRVERRRDAAANAGDHVQAIATGNLMLRRDLFDQVGGFCEAYRHYGFEDRDLVVCLLARGVEPVYDPGAAVIHHAGYSVAGYCRKLRDAAAHTAPIFRTRHPQTYRELSYARIDPDLRPRFVGTFMRLVGRSTAAAATSLVGGLVAQQRLPWALRYRALQVAAALSFIAGAAERP